MTNHSRMVKRESHKHHHPGSPRPPLAPASDVVATPSTTPLHRRDTSTASTTSGDSNIIFLNQHQKQHQDTFSSMNSSFGNSSFKSIDSVLTDISTATEKKSNTSTTHLRKLRKGQELLQVIQNLLNILQSQDPILCQQTEEVLRRCGRKGTDGVGKNTNDVDEWRRTCFSDESVKSQLKQVVGSRYWKAANNNVIHKHNIDRINKSEDSVSLSSSATSKMDLEPLPPKGTIQFTKSDVEFLTTSSLVNKSNKKNSSSNSSRAAALVSEEQKIRKERFWMLIRVLLKYLELKQPTLYDPAKRIIAKCGQQAKKHNESFQVMQKNIQTQLKELVGRKAWRKSESYLFEILSRKADQEDQARLQLVATPTDDKSNNEQQHLGDKFHAISLSRRGEVTPDSSPTFGRKSRGKSLSRLLQQQTQQNTIQTSSSAPLASPGDYPRPIKRVRF